MLTLLLFADKTTNEMTTNEMTTSETSKTSEKKYQTSGCACETHELRATRTANPRDQNQSIPLVCRVPILSSRNRASPTSVLADEKVMLEKEPILALAEEKEIIGLMSSPAKEEDEDEASKEPYITSTKSPFAILGGRMDAEVATEAAGSLDKLSGWFEGGIASAGKIVDKMSGCARAPQVVLAQLDNVHAGCS